MTDDQHEAIEEFFLAVEKLKWHCVIRSDRSLGDIAEFLCVSEFGMDLATTAREPGYDGHLSAQKLQVKYHGANSTTVECGDPGQYDELIVVLGRSSVLRPDCAGDPFLLYRIPSTIVKEKGAHADGKYRFTRTQLPQQCLVRRR